MNRVLHALRQAVAEPAQTDGQLLEAYRDYRDGAAFAELVRRHGPVVWGVCRRMLPNRQDAEDAFQATFLVLVRKPASVRPPERVGSWLYGVAVRAARKAATAVARRRERQVETIPETAAVEEGIWRDVLPILDEELVRLPDRYRSVLVLCDLERQTRREAAGRLGVPEGTVAGRLARARALLGKRLARRGVATPVLAVLISERVTSAVVPPPVLGATIEAATLVRETTPGVTALTEGVVRAMSLTKLKVTAMAVVAGLGLMAAGATSLIRPTAAAEPFRSETTRWSTTPAGGGARLVSPVPNPVLIGSEVSPTRYRALLGQILGVLAEHFEVIVSANSFEGRIEARQPLTGRSVIVEIRTSEGGGHWVSVRVQQKTTERDFDLEQTILRELVTLNQVTPISRAAEPGADHQIRRLQREVDGLRERVRDLERKQADR